MCDICDRSTLSNVIYYYIKNILFVHLRHTHKHLLISVTLTCMELFLWVQNRRSKFNLYQCQLLENSENFEIVVGEQFVTWPSRNRVSRVKKWSEYKSSNVSITAGGQMEGGSIETRVIIEPPNGSCCTNTDGKPKVIHIPTPFLVDAYILHPWPPSNPLVQ